MEKMRFRAGLLALVLAAGACDQGTDPDAGPTFDADATLEDLEAVSEVIGSDELASFRALGGRTALGEASGIDAMAVLVAPVGTGESDAFIRALTERLGTFGRSASGAPATAPVISSFTRGATFVYDSIADRYALAPGRTGAPEHGVRFILYPVTLLGRPVPTQEIGYADLVDLGDTSAEDISLRLTVVIEGTTVLQYATTLDETETGGALTVSGYLRPEEARLDFAIEATATSSEQGNLLDVGFDLEVEARALRISGDLMGIEAEGEGDGAIEIVVERGDASIVVGLESSGGVLDGAVHVNDELFATVSGPREEPVFLGAEGEPLTLREALVLHRIVDKVEDVFDLLEDLLDPVDDLVFLGILL